jgi:hypothetical protein
VEAEPAGRVLVDQVRCGQPAEQNPGVLGGEVGERGGALGGHVLPRQQTEEPEQPAGIGGKALIGNVEGGFDSAVMVVVDRQERQPVAGPQLAGVLGDAAAGLVGEIGRGDPQRQRQERARVGQLGGRVGLGLDPVPAQQPRQQLAASAGASTPNGRRRAPSRAASPMSRSRLVTSTRLPGLAGSSGRTCSATWALSNRISTRRSASSVRYSPAAASASTGICSGATPSPYTLPGP